MGIDYEVLNTVHTYRKKFYYKGVAVNILGIPLFLFKDKKKVANSVSRLKQKGYMEIRNEYLSVTESGKSYLQKNKSKHEIFSSELSQKNPKDLIVMYDIPENMKKERNWFRFHLRKFHFIMIQKSVWVGPSPLPKEFLEYVKKIGIKDTFKTFRLERGYTMK